MSAAESKKADLMAKARRLASDLKNASKIPGTTAGGRWPIAEKGPGGMVQDKFGRPGYPTPSGGVFITPAWTKAMGTYKPGQKINEYGLPDNDQVRKMVERGEIDP